jgi:hypothetical protein
MKIDNNTLIDDLLRRMETATAKVKTFRQLSIHQLSYKRGDQWSILECIEHLNRYGDFYLVEIENRIIENKNRPGSKVFYSGLLGNYFANLMEVKDGKMTKMKSPKDKNPANVDLSETTIIRFLKQQEQLVNLLSSCRSMDLTRTKCAISLTRLIKLRLGDTLRFFTYHIERHVLQAERIFKEENFMTPKIRVSLDK